MDLSIIVPIYKINESYLKILIRCFNIQSHCKKFEVIFVIDEPNQKDYYINVINDNIQVNINYQIIVNEKNLGLGMTRNQGIKFAKSKYVSFVDSDDQIAPSYVFEIINLIKQYPNEPVFKINYLASNHSSTQVVSNLKDTKISAWASWLYIVKLNFIKEHQIYFYNENIIYEDVYWFFKLMLHLDHWVELDKLLYLYTVNRIDSIMYKNKNIFKNIINELNVMSLAKKIYTNPVKFSFNELRHYIVKTLFKKLFSKK